MSRFRIDPNFAERAAGLLFVGGGVGWALHPAWGLVAAGGVILSFDVLDWLLTWKRTAQAKGAD